MDNRYVELFKVTKAYPNPYGEAIKVVEDFNLILQEGEVVSLIGHSGCGKSTVLTMIAGLNEITAGDVVVAGHAINGPGPDRGVVFQAPCLMPWMSAFQNVMLGVRRCYPHVTSQERRQLVEYYLSLVGLADAMHKYPRELSGGMQQRVGIARALALQPKMLLLDEPFGRLDSLTRMELQDVLLELLEQNKMTAMMVTHDVDEAMYVADRVIMMTNGPRARVGDVLEVSFARPRVRAEVLEHPEYYDLRARMIDFLEKHEKAPKRKTSPAPEPNTEPEIATEDALATDLA